MPSSRFGLGQVKLSRVSEHSKPAEQWEVPHSGRRFLAGPELDTRWVRGPKPPVELRDDLLGPGEWALARLVGQPP